MAFTLEKDMGKFFSGLGFWLFFALLFGWWLWDAFTTPFSEKLNELFAIGIIVVIFIITISLAYIIDNSPNKKTPPKPVTRLPIKNSLNNPGAKLSDFANSPLGESMAKFIRGKK